jgi:hypothetical protein
MAIPDGISCELCLRADEPESMLSVAIPYAAHNPDRVVVICRDCGNAVVELVELVDSAQADEEPVDR